MANFFNEMSRPCPEERKEVEGLWPRYIPRHRELLTRTNWFQKLDGARQEKLKLRQSRIPGPSSLYDEFSAFKLLASFAHCMLKEVGRIDVKHGRKTDWCANGVFTTMQLCKIFFTSLHFYPNKPDSHGDSFMKHIDRRKLYVSIVRAKLYNINRQISQIIDTVPCERSSPASTGLNCIRIPGERPVVQISNWTLARHFSEGLLSTPACKEIDSFDDVQQFIREADDATYAQLPLELLIWDFLTSFLGCPTSDLSRRHHEQSTILLCPERQGTVHPVFSAPEAVEADKTERESHEEQHLGLGAISRDLPLAMDTTSTTRTSSSRSKYSRSTFESDQSPPLPTSDPLSIIYDMYAASSLPLVSIESVGNDVPPSIATRDISPILRTGTLTRSVENHGVCSVAQRSHRVVMVHSLDTSSRPSILESDAVSTGTRVIGGSLSRETALSSDAIEPCSIRESAKPSLKKLHWPRHTWSRRTVRKTSKHRVGKFLDTFTANAAIEKSQRSMQPRNYNRTLQHTSTTLGR